MISLIRPILFSFIQSRAVKKLVVELLEALAKRTDNQLDDQAVAVIKSKLL
jgi:hypothetical protein